MTNRYRKVHRCRKCGVALDDDNWYPAHLRRSDYICKKCANKQVRLWEKNNPEKRKASYTREHRKNGHLPMSDNKDCASYLGVYIAERVLRHTFKDVEMMPYNNKGYDFVCNKGMLIDGKSSCKLKKGGWKFNITRNKIADYFLCLAFDNRRNLNTLYAWLLPGDKFNHLTSAGISPSTIHKWDEYKLDINKISACCDIMKKKGD